MSSRQLRKLTRKIGAKTGPVAPEQSHKPSIDPIRHELLAKTVVLSTESVNRFNLLVRHYVERFQPSDEVEMDLVDDMIVARWRLHRIWVMQKASLDWQMDKQEREIEKTFGQIDNAVYTTVAFTTLANTDKALHLMLRMETTLNRMYNRALKTLQDLQKHCPRPAESATSENLRNDPKPAESVPRKAPAVDRGEPEPTASEPAREPDDPEGRAPLLE